MTTWHCPTVIVGAGLCGLSAAYHLQEGKADYLLLERNREVGGLARTVTYDGFSFDHAIHVLYSRDPYATDLICNVLLEGNTHKQRRRSYCYAAGVYVQYPYQTNNYGLPPTVIVKNILGLIEARYERPLGGAPSHFEAWIYQTYGRGIAEHFMIPYNRRQWAWDLREMSYEWVADRIPMPEIADVLRGALQAQSTRYGSNHEFWYPREGGIEALPRAFLHRIPPERLWLDATVVAVDGLRREVLLADGRRVRYDHLISTMPLPALVALLGDGAPSDIKQCAAGLKHNTVHTVNIGLDGTDLGTEEAAHWIYFSEEGTLFHRASFPCNFSPAMVPPGCSSIQVEISESAYRPCNRAALVEQSLTHLVRVGILKEGDARPTSDGGRVRVARVVTLDPAYIIYDVKHRENTQAVKSYLRGLGIVTSGRFGEWEYLNMDHAILSGKAAAEAAAG